MKRPTYVLRQRAPPSVAIAVQQIPRKPILTPATGGGGGRSVIVHPCLSCGRALERRPRGPVWRMCWRCRIREAVRTITFGRRSW